MVLGKYWLPDYSAVNRNLSVSLQTNLNIKNLYVVLGKYWLPDYSAVNRNLSVSLQTNLNIKNLYVVLGKYWLPDYSAVNRNLSVSLVDGLYVPILPRPRTLLAFLKRQLRPFGRLGSTSERLWRRQVPICLTTTWLSEILSSVTS